MSGGGQRNARPGSDRGVLLIGTFKSRCDASRAQVVRAIGVKRGFKRRVPYPVHEQGSPVNVKMSDVDLVVEKDVVWSISRAVRCPARHLDANAYRNFENARNRGALGSRQCIGFLRQPRGILRRGDNLDIDIASDIGLALLIGSGQHDRLEQWHT